MTSPQVKTLGAESLMSFISHVLSQLVAQRIVSRGTSCLVSSGLHSMCLFPLLIVLCVLSLE